MVENVAFVLVMRITSDGPRTDFISASDDALGSNISCSNKKGTILLYRQ
jgi:hypothetical protein